MMRRFRRSGPAASRGGHHPRKCGHQQEWGRTGGCHARVKRDMIYVKSSPAGRWRSASTASAQTFSTGSLASQGCPADGCEDARIAEIAAG